MTDTNNQQLDAEIPDSAFTNCPLGETFPLVKVNTHCIECAYFVGLGKRESPRLMSFFKQYKIGCNHPVYREIQEVKM